MSSGTLGSNRFTLSPYTSSGRSSEARSEAKKRQLEDTGSEGDVTMVHAFTVTNALEYVSIYLYRMYASRQKTSNWSL